MTPSSKPGSNTSGMLNTGGKQKSANRVFSMLANRYVPMYPRASSSQCHSPGRSQCSEEQHSSPNRQAEETLTLDNFMLKCVHSLPLRIVVEKGYFVCDERCSIATGDVYNVHFVKRNKVALLRDLGDKVYNIPLNSAIQFGPIFNPKGDLKAAMQGYRFERVSDVMAQIQLPKVILATKPHIRSNPKSSVEQYEILVVQKIVQTPMKKKALQVYSITRREQKMLDSDCLGRFTTDPYGSCLHLPDIIEHFSNEFPLEVQVVMKEASMPENIPYEITSEASFLTGVHTETSLVVSTTLKEDEDQKPIEIPVDLPIDVKVIQLEKAELERLYAYTRKLYERFDAFSTLSIKTSSSKLCTAVRSGFEREGVELQKPDSVYDTLIPSQSPVIPQRVNALATHNRSGPSTPLHPTPKPKLHSKQQQSPQAATGSAPADSKKGVRHNYTPLNILTPTKRKSYETCKPNLSSVRPSGSLTTTKSSEMGTTTNLIEFRKLLARVEMLEREVYALRSEIATLKSQGGSGAVMSKEQALQKENIQILKTFSIKRVAELLQAMNLSQYCERFISEHITGEILTECDEKILVEDLGVSSRIHCMQLLQVIRGRTSATALLANQSPCS